MTTRIEHLNRSLQRIGAKALQSESAPGAEKLIRLYEDCLELLLGLRPMTFKFSHSTVQLGRDLEGSPHPFWKYRYKLPADRLGPPIAVFDCPRAELDIAGGVPFTDFEYHGAHLVTDAETIFARVQIKPAIALWPPLFIQCQLGLVASEAAKMLHEDDKTRLQLRREVLGDDDGNPGAGGLVAKAGNIEAMSSPSEVLMTSGGPLIDVRR